MNTPRSQRDAADLAVITVSYGSGAVLEEFLRSLDGATTENSVTVVVDNLPEGERGVAGVAAEHGAVYVPLPENPGYGGAVNRAVRALPPSIEWLLISNPDVVLGPASIDRLLAVARRERSVAAVGPLIRNSDGSVYPSARSVPSLRAGTGHALFANVWPSNPWSRRYRSDATDRGVRTDVGWLSGSCLLVNRARFDEIGGFDTGFFMYFEDVDLGYRLHRNGGLNIYEPAAAVVHTGAHATRSSQTRMLAAHHESARRFISKRYSSPILLPLRVVLRAGLRIREFVVTRKSS